MSRHHCVKLAICLVSFASGPAGISSAMAEYEDRDRISTTREVLAETAVGAIFGPTEQEILGEYLRHKRTRQDRQRDGRDDSSYDEDSRSAGEYYDPRDGSYRQSHKGRDKPKKLPPGLRKKLERGGELPPGWQDKVARGEVIDEELYYRTRPVPDDIIRRLPYIEGTSIREIDDRIVRVQDATRTVLDVFYLMQHAR